MADAKIHALIQAVNRLVVEDTGTRSLATDNQLVGRVTRSDRRRLAPLADNLDLPARLAPRPGEPDSRAEIRAALTEVVAGCAGVLEPREPVPETANKYGRARLGTAMSRAYAAFATPRLVSRLVPNGRPDDLGVFPVPTVEGDVAAARAIAVAISARNGRPEETIVTELVAAGRGAVAPAAAQMLLRSRPGFAALPAPERNALTRMVGDHLESVFESSDPQRLRAGRNPIEVMQDRQTAVGVGAGAVTGASIRATEEIQHLHRFFGQRGWPAAVEQPESVYELCERIQGAVGELTGAPESRWNGTLQEELGQAPDTTLRLTREHAMALGKLLESSAGRPLEPVDASAAREAVQVAASSYARWAVPAEYDDRHEAATQAVATRFAAIEQAVGTAFAEDNFREIVDRSLPAELADQVRRAAPPEPDREYAPAARGFAAAVDTAVGRPPGETLRQMAGEGPLRMAQVAAEALVADSAVENVERPFAHRLITDEIDKSFEELPLDDPHSHGRQTAKVAEAMAEVYGDDPGTARRESAAVDRAQAGDPLRFAPGHDPAAAAPRGATVPATAPTAGTSVTSTRAERHDRDR